jgi:hypothetical protein
MFCDYERKRNYLALRKAQINLAFHSFFRNFAPVNQELRRHITSWLLLAVFVPMLVLSSVHIHETGETITTECVDCVHHSCHGHMTAGVTWAHDCVLCQFLTLTMLAVAASIVLFLWSRGERVFAPIDCRVAMLARGVVTLRGPPFCLKG